MTADHVNKRTCLCRWTNEEIDDAEGQLSTAAAKRQKRANSFATLSLKLELVAGESSEDENENESDIE